MMPYIQGYLGNVAATTFNPMGGYSAIFLYMLIGAAIGSIVLPIIAVYLLTRDARFTGRYGAWYVGLEVAGVVFALAALWLTGQMTNGFRLYQQEQWYNTILITLLFSYYFYIAIVPFFAFYRVKRTAPKALP